MTHTKTKALILLSLVTLLPTITSCAKNITSSEAMEFIIKNYTSDEIRHAKYTVIYRIDVYKENEKEIEYSHSTNSKGEIDMPCIGGDIINIFNTMYGINEEDIEFTIDDKKLTCEGKGKLFDHDSECIYKFNDDGFPTYEFYDTYEITALGKLYRNRYEYKYTY